MKEEIFRTVWELRKEGYAPSTIEGYGNKLWVLSRIADLNCPESVREAIAGKNCSVAYQEALIFAYRHYVRFNSLVWNPPCCKRQRGLLYIASRKIRLYDLRHFFATMVYHKTKDILYLKQQLGHKRIEDTLVHTHLFDFGDDEYVCKVAGNSQEARTLVE